MTYNKILVKCTARFHDTSLIAITDHVMQALSQTKRTKNLARVRHRPTSDYVVEVQYYIMTECHQGTSILCSAVVHDEW